MRIVREAMAELTGAAMKAVAGIAMTTAMTITTATKTTGKKTGG